jgi:hypothetical protein
MLNLGDEDYRGLDGERYSYMLQSATSIYKIKEISYTFISLELPLHRSMT